MIRKELDDEWIATKYEQGYSCTWIAEQIGEAPQLIVNRVNQLRDAGKVTRVRTSQEQRHINAERVREEIRQLLIAGHKDHELAERFQVSKAMITKRRTELYREGKLQKQKRKVTTKTRQKPTRIINGNTFVPSTLAEGETVSCNWDIARTCVYGSRKEAGFYCSYALITGKCRSIGEGGCDYKACTKYSKISRDNPRLERRDDLGAGYTGYVEGD